ncbi:hypothetical protein ACFPAG_03300 [Vogesella sp. GCM10023246]|uniref:Uncharacterized protein n=1 Tax=Vogesella oryzagri TaxID=3160864 RepID=A0ABV1M3W0_9NEIS
MARHQTYTDLVEGDDDTIGRIAYSIYKGEKLAWMQSYEKAHGREPTDDEVFVNFHHSVPGKLRRYRADALALVNRYIDQEMETELIKYKFALKNDLVIQKIDKGFWRNTFENGLAGLFQAAIVVVVSTILWIYSLTPDNMISNAKKNLGEIVHQRAPELAKTIASEAN